MLIATLALAAGAKAVLYDTLDPDCFWHLRVADALAAGGVRPLVDDLSFASLRTPWVPYSWLAELGMRAAWRSAGGYRAAVAAAGLMQAGFVLAVAWTAWEAAPRDAGRPRQFNVALVAAGGAFLAMPFLSFRPVTAALLLVAAAAAALQRDRRLGERTRAAWAVPVLAALATNLHLFAFLLPAMTGALAAGAAWEWARERGDRRATSQQVVPVAARPLSGAAPPALSGPAPRRGLSAPARRVGSWVRDACDPARRRRADARRRRRAAREQIAAMARAQRSPQPASAGAPPLRIIDRYAYRQLLEQHETCAATHRDAGRRLRRYAVLTGLTLAGYAAHPMLPGVIRSAVRYGFADVMVAGPVIAEMQPLWRGPMGCCAAALALAAIACAAARGRHRLRAGEAIWVLAGSLLLLRMGRMAPAFAILAAPASVATMPRLRDRALSLPPVRVALAALLALGLLRVARDFPAAGQPMSQWLERLGPDVPGYPVAAADYVEQRPTTSAVSGGTTPSLAGDPATAPASPGRLLCEFSWGGYLEWRLGARYQTLVDGRTQVFPPSLWQTLYGDAADVAPRGAHETARETLVAASGADVAVVPAGRSVLRPALLRLGWRQTFADARAQVWELPPPAVGRAVTATADDRPLP